VFSLRAPSNGGDIMFVVHRPRQLLKLLDCSTRSRHIRHSL
jgi:hypothetical protein